MFYDRTPVDDTRTDDTAWPRMKEFGTKCGSCRKVHTKG